MYRWLVLWMNKWLVGRMYDWLVGWVLINVWTDG